MRLTVLAVGTRGDVQPYVALGVGLRRAGHDVRLATHETFKGLVEAHELEFFQLPGDPRTLFDHADWQTRTVSRRAPLAHARLLYEALSPLLSAVELSDYRAACRGADGVVFTMTSEPARGVARALDIPSACAAYDPFHRTGSFPQPILFPGANLGRVANKLSYPVAERILRQPFQEPLKPSARRAVGLAVSPMSDRGSESWPPFTVVHGFSPSLVPRPADWPSHLHVSGAWEIPTLETQLAPEVEDFLAAGDPPIYFGLGSMRPADPSQLSAVVAEAARSVGRRLIIQSGWGDLHTRNATRGNVLVVKDVSHQLLFPRVRAVAHHGGAGTTHAGLTAGRPTLVVPFVFDQFFWGHRVHDLGVGARPLQSDRATPSHLREAFECLDSSSVQEAAGAMGAHMRSERGVDGAVEVLVDALT